VEVQLKIRQQVQKASFGQKGYTGPLQLLRKLGLSGAYHGTGITLARDIPSFGTYFIVYKVALLFRRDAHLM
jgi:solute carrier family 25 (mitochondrial carnitine/acylcarnitine transporter), member 20/29